MGGRLSPGVVIVACMVRFHGLQGAIWFGFLMLNRTVIVQCTTLNRRGFCTGFRGIWMRLMLVIVFVLRIFVKEGKLTGRGSLFRRSPELAYLVLGE